tara:strand:+ start:97 stop:735 length:639 start_codon:yes stop_codon:yes gene_type:complete
MNKSDLKELLVNFTTGKKKVTAMVKDWDMCGKFNDRFLESLLTYHPTRYNVKNIEYLIVRPHAVFKTRTLFYKTANYGEQDASYVKCIKNLFGGFDHNQDLKKRKTDAFRNAICNTKRRTFRLSKPSNCCEDCGNYSESPHVDHYKISFKQILEQFLTLNKKTLDQIDTQFEQQHQIKDQKLKHSFIEYHDSIVIYKLLCPSCNLSNGSYGY